jgi:DHA1 family multidrug resistance protein-like MFS transporter
MLLCLAETSTPTILLRRAQRLRKLTSSPLFQSSGEIADAHLSAGAIVADALVKPLEISLKDPSVGFTNAYVSLTYSIYYMFFEIFGLVYPPLYHFTLPQLSTLFVCIIVACFLGASVYSSYLYFYVNPSLGNKRTPPPQEHRLLAAIPASVLPPIGLFLFGWAARADIHWIVSVSGIVIYSAGVFVILQCVSIYIPCSYPKYAASLFAANDFCRSALAAGAIHFARPLYLNLGIARGVSVLAGVSTLGVVGILLIWRFGAVLRAKSKFAVS